MIAPASVSSKEQAKLQQQRIIFLRASKNIHETITPSHGSYLSQNLNVANFMLFTDSFFWTVCCSNLLS